MGKDLRTTSVQLKLHRCPKLNADAWGFVMIQPFFPSLEKLFKTEGIPNLREYGVRLSQELDSIVDVDHIRVGKKTLAVHRKTTMLLSPYKTMRGDYEGYTLPKPSEIASEMTERLHGHHTAGYVGALASIALSESGCPHFPRVYGVYTGIVREHTVDVSDDYEDLTTRPWFAENIGKTFELKLRKDTGESEFSHTRRQRLPMELGEETPLVDIQDIDADHISNPGTCPTASEVPDSKSDSYLEDGDTSTTSEDVFDIESCECSDSEGEDEEDDDEEEPFAWATFKHVPVITTVMEVCEGTFYDLVEEHPEPEKHVAWVSQIVFALAFAQRAFAFTHNDLHGNNVMYVKTDQEYLYYNHAGICYRVPTHGYLIKIIDFDRAVVSLRLQGMKEPRTFMSNQFHADEEAAGQYNIHPFYDANYAVVPPNSSFDLVRFATSVFWDMFPEGPDHDYKHPLFSVLKQWMTLPDGTSVMFRKQRDNHDRYHGFNLYKAIARYCKDTAVPRREILKLTHYQIPVIPLGASRVDIPE